jgi:DNA-directed RNA polymerase specialized sigma24 family protein
MMQRLEYSLARYSGVTCLCSGRQHATKEDARRVAQDVNRERQESGLPPFTHLLTLRAERFDRRALVDVLSTLPKREPTAVMLIDGKGLSYAQAAETMQVPIKTFTTYVANARASLLLSYDSMEVAVPPEQVLNVDPL